MSRIFTATQNFITIQLGNFAPTYAKLQVVHAGSFFGVLTTRYPQGRCDDFDVQYIRQKTSFRARMCLLDIPKTKFYILTPFSPKNANFRLIFDGTVRTKNLGSKRALTWGTSSVSVLKTRSCAFGS